jgi:hypothetical protein
MKKILAVSAVLFLALAVIVSPGLASQLSSNQASVNLNYVIGESLTVSATPSTATFSGATPTTGVISISTVWNLASNRSGVWINWGFSSPTAALSNGSGSNIPSSEVFANINGGAYSACTQTAFTNVSGLTPGAVCGGYPVAIFPASPLSGSDIAPITLQLQGLPTALPAGTYTGTLQIIAGAI